MHAQMDRKSTLKIFTICAKIQEGRGHWTFKPKFYEHVFLFFALKLCKILICWLKLTIYKLFNQ